MPQPDSLMGELEPIERASVDELARAAAGPAAPVAAARLPQRAALPGGVRRRRGAPGRLQGAGRPGAASRSPARPTCGRTTRSGCSRCPGSRSRGCTRRHGTTGRATVVGYTAGRSGRVGDGDGAVDPRGGRAARAPGARGVRVRAVHRGLGAHYGAERLGCTVVPVSGGMTERQVILIRDFRPDIIMVTPSYMLAIIDEMERQGDDPAASSLRFGIFGAEPWTNEMRAAIEARAGLTRRTSTGCPR